MQFPTVLVFYCDVQGLNIQIYYMYIVDTDNPTQNKACILQEEHSLLTGA